MARRSEKQEQMTTQHPYKHLEELKLWSVVEKAIQDLIGNQDIKPMTRSHYIVGHIVRKILDEYGNLDRQD